MAPTAGESKEQKPSVAVFFFAFLAVFVVCGVLLR
ncbi:kinetoplast-associated protein-like protein [Leishmania infantum JPCM5]|uniref:Kinetoplast-associated_protein-like_protein n=3 Tax=Leishmania donovani species complex TaxID=38574 RepID=A0A6L0XH35_LEIIN|nr:kinetoplast-associated protein-like protein [Leishmania infantum JPCM5]CAC9498614.1 kinetoplast-associated_protein-like_protein [Leishmania infantum]CAM69004.2 kinetoplast-associated protein-like protein [Leishmania infantum JPCM5]SUZ42896.1 kinetoplast-associated_protein-like_protein [Leishmania infantum]|eukprot:XP_001466293.2 kinetoplast-associated protein-like protein [Leishmania infantum JPCM5]